MHTHDPFVTDELRRISSSLVQLREDSSPPPWLHASPDHVEAERGTRLKGRAAAEVAAPRAQEAELQRRLLDALDRHPAWSWLGRLDAVPPLAAARLLTRLDPAASRNPLAFWTKCGLDAGFNYRLGCTECELGIALRAPHALDADHMDPDSGMPCPGTMVPHFRPVGADAERADPATPRRAFNTIARKSCLAICTRLSDHPGPFRAYFRSARARLRSEQGVLDAVRLHNYALVRMEQLFLLHLWSTWRSELGLPEDNTLAAKLAGAEFADPWALLVSRMR